MIHDLFVKEKIEGLAGHITLDRPRALNALSFEMITFLYQILTTWKNTDAVQWVMVDSTSARAFCAGGDIRAVYEAHHKKETTISDEIFRCEYQLNYLIHCFAKPYISFLHGITMGGGMGISMHGSHRVVSETSTLAMPEVTIGFFPDVGATSFLNQCPGHVGLYLGLTGERITGDDALSFGLATHKIEHDNQEKVQKALQGAPRQSDPTSYVDDVLDTYKLASHPTAFEENLPFIDAYFGAATLEALMQNLQESDEVLARQTYTLLKCKSPTSLAVTFKQLTEGRSLGMDDVLRREFRLSQRFVKDHDFMEGIRAILIDKDQSPKWHPQTLAGVDGAIVDHYFSPLDEKELILL